MAAGSDIPGLGNQLEVTQQRILLYRLQQRCPGIETVIASRKRSCEIETKSVHASCFRVVTQDIHRETEHCRLIECERVATTGVVDIARGVTCDAPIVGRVVEATQRDGRPERIAFAGVIEDDVENYLDAGAVQRCHTRGKFIDASGCKPWIGDEQRTGVVAPVIG